MEKNNEEKKDELKSLIEENIALNKEMKEMIIKIHRYVFIRRIVGLIKIIFIVLLIFAAFIWLPPFLEGIMSQFNEIYSDIINPGN